MKQHQNLRKNEQGVVSMIVVIIVMLLLTLIVLAMSRNANREQRQALDRQLSSQAYYASESGINDTVDYVVSNVGAVGFQKEKNDCNPLNGYNNQISDQGPVEYSCIMYDTNPDNLAYGPIEVDKSEVIPIEPSAGTLANLTISWDEDGGSGNIAGCASKSTDFFPTVSGYDANNCSAGVLRVDLIDPRSGLGRDTLSSNNFVSFFVPKDDTVSGQIGHNAAKGNNGGRVVSAKCEQNGTPRKCQATITGLNLAAGDRMYLKIRSLYTKNNVSITGANTSGGTVQFEKAQVMVDSTGKANDVLKRLQVRVPLTSKYPYPEFAIQTAGDICKKLSVTPTDVNVLSPCRAAN